MDKQLQDMTKDELVETASYLLAIMRSIQDRAQQAETNYNKESDWGWRAEDLLDFRDAVERMSHEAIEAVS
jgi:hypothetical protein